MSTDRLADLRKRAAGRAASMPGSDDPATPEEIAEQAETREMMGELQSHSHAWLAEDAELSLLVERQMARWQGVLAELKRLGD